MERIVESSKAIFEDYVVNGIQGLPWDKLEEGKSFYVSEGMVRETSLRSYVSNSANKLNKKFKCLKHRFAEGVYFEVACIGEETTTIKAQQRVIPAAHPSSPKMLEAKYAHNYSFAFNEIKENNSGWFTKAEYGDEAMFAAFVDAYNERFRKTLVYVFHDEGWCEVLNYCGEVIGLVDKQSPVTIELKKRLRKFALLEIDKIKAEMQTEE